MPGAARLIRQALVDLAAEGSAVVVISQDLDELFEIADRIAVIQHGQLEPAPKPASRMDPRGDRPRDAGGGAHPRSRPMRLELTPRLSIALWRALAASVRGLRRRRSWSRAW